MSEISDGLRVVAAEVKDLRSAWDERRAELLSTQYGIQSDRLDQETGLDLVRIHLLLAGIDERLKQTWQQQWHLEQALAVLADNKSEQPDLRIMTLSGLARLSEESAQFAAAHRWYERGLAEARRAAEELPREGSTRTQELLQTLLAASSTFFVSVGNYRSAEVACREAVDLMRRGTSRSLTHRRSVVTSLCLVSLSLGDRALTAELERERLELSESQGDQPALVQDLTALARSCFSQGQQDQARGYLSRASEVLESGGLTPGERPKAEMAIAECLEAFGDTAGAEQHLETLLSLRHVDRELRAETAARLARLYARCGVLGVALEMSERALSVRDDPAVQDPAALSRALVSAAALRRQMNDLATADRYARRAAHLPTPVGTSVNAIRELARVCIQAGRGDEALTWIRQAINLDDVLVDHVLAMASDPQRSSFLRLLRVTTALALTMAVEDPRLVPEAWSLLLRRKGLDAEAIAARRAAADLDVHPTLRDDFETMRACRAELVEQALAALSGQVDTRAADLAAQLAVIEKRIAQQIPEIGVVGRLRQVNPSAVGMRLPDGAAVVDFVQFGREDLSSSEVRAAAVYAAFVQVSRRDAEPVLVVLGSKSEIDEAIDRYRSAVLRPGSSAPPVAAPTTLAAAERELVRLLVRPLLPLIGHSHTWLLSPDAELSRVPFQALLSAGGRLINDHTISYLDSPRHLVTWRQPVRGHSGMSLVVADPDFDLLHPAASTSIGGPRTDPPTDAGEQNFFDPLPGARIEGAKVAALLQGELLTGAAALKTAVAERHSPGVLHFATHGFFWPEQTPASQSAQPMATQSDFARRRAADNPLLRCGLALAGANSWLRYGRLQGPAGDGILSGEDAAALHLSGTELVVLSACDTGAGEVRVGEGVIGLARAFLLAGAATVITSLWRVPDRVTEALMVVMYDWLRSGAPRSEALRQAQLDVMSVHPHPRLWAGFICLGDPGPMLFPTTQGAALDRPRP